MHRLWAGAVAQLTGRLRLLPRSLVHDLWTTAVDPPPRPDRPSLHEWLPAFLLPLMVCTVPLAVFSINTLVEQYGLDNRSAVLLGVLQSVAFIAALYRPVPAWWAVTAVMVVVALTARPEAGDGSLPWTASGIVAQAGVLLMMALRLRPRVGVEALVLCVLAGLACTPTTSCIRPPTHGSPWPSSSRPSWSVWRCAAVRSPAPNSWRRKNAPRRSAAAAPSWRSATASPANSTTWSPTTCR